MTDILVRMLLWLTIGLALVLPLRKPARRAFGAGPAFTLWLLPVVLAFAPWWPRGLAPAAVWSLPALVVTPGAALAAHSTASLLDWKRWMVMLWLAGAAAGLVRLAAHYVRLRLGERRAPSAWARWLADAAPGLDLRRVRVHAAGPAVLWALPRALILLPADFAERFESPAFRELVLRHESTHAHRGDAWWTLAMEIVSALLWFHPLAWLARPRFRLDQELACDAASLRAMPSRASNYARALVDSIAVQPAPALIPWLAEPQLKERIAMITRIPPGTPRRRAGFFAVAALLTGGLWFAGGQAPLDAATPASSTSASTPPSVDATFKNHNPPKYPAQAIQKGEYGKVLLDITVDATGKVTGVQIDQKGTDAPVTLQNAAMIAAINWRFTPGIKNGHTVGGVVQVPVKFSLSPASDGSAAASCPPGFQYKQESGKSYSCTATTTPYAPPSPASSP